MILDKQLELNDAQEKTAQATTDSDNIIDMTVAGDAGVSLWLIIRIVTAVTSGGAGTVQFKAIHDSAVGFGASPVTFFDSGALAKGTMVAGYTVVKMRLPANMGRFMKITTTIATADLTAGAWDSFLTETPDHKSNYSN